MTRYKWKLGIPKPKVDADVFAAEIERIAMQKGGPVKPGDIVAAAEELGSPLAPLFEADDQVAAHKFRVVQARHLMGALQVVRVSIENGTSLSSRAFHSVRENGSTGYVSESRVIGDKDLRKQLIGSAARELHSFITRFQGIAAMGNFISRLQDLSDEMRDAVDALELDATMRRPQTVKPEAQAERTAA